MTEYVATGKEAAEKFMNGESVWSVSMGGLGPGYEQAIQVGIFSLIHALDGIVPDHPREASNILDEKLIELSRKGDWGLSGAQAGAIKQVAYQFMRHGYRRMMEKAPKDRKIQVSKEWPQPVAQ